MVWRHNIIRPMALLRAMAFSFVQPPRRYPCHRISPWTSIMWTATFPAHKSQVERHRVIRATKIVSSGAKLLQIIMGFGWRAAGVILTTCLLLVGIEGLASYTLVARNVIETKSLSTRRYTKYDANLGWVNEPNVFLPDMYGPGIYLRTNAQQFRANHDTTTVVQEGKIRIVCSGDSFTEGYGVDNDHAWCERLSTLNPKLETVNMGQDGYGADQAYLWYKQGGAKIEHQIHLFAFITDDFYRMLNDTFWDYAKPRLEIENGVLVARNVPVPRRSYYFPWITQNVGNLKNLRTVQLLDRLLRKIKPTPKVAPQLSQKERDEKARQLLRTIFADLKRLNEQCSSKLVLVYLPTIWELN